MTKKQSIGKTVLLFNLDKITLYQYLNKKKISNKMCIWFAGQAHTIFLLHMVKDMAAHIKSLANLYHGLTGVKCKELAYEFALYNNLAIKKCNDSAQQALILLKPLNVLQVFKLKFRWSEYVGWSV